MSERESCNSRHLSWLIKSCFPNTTSANAITSNPNTRFFPPQPPHQHPCTAAVTFSSLPDDILLECISRVPPSSISVLPQVCRRWAHLVASPSFSNLRRLHGHLHHALFALSASSSDSTLFAAALRFHTHTSLALTWKVSAFLPNDALPTTNAFPNLFSHARLCAVGHRIYVIGRTATLGYDTWTGSVTARSPMLFPRKKFAAAAVAGKIYVAGGGGGPSATVVEEYDPDTDNWSVVSQAPRRRYGCIGASARGKILCVIGGLKIGESGGGAAHMYASSMDLYDVEARGWLRSRTVPGGGCVVAACAAGAEGDVYVLASHAVELSFWRFQLKGSTSNCSRKGELWRGGDGNGEWCRIRSPPVAAAQVRVESRVRYSCLGVGNKVVLVQLYCSGGSRLGLCLVYNTVVGEWSRAPDLPDVITRAAACVSLEC